MTISPPDLKVPQATGVTVTEDTLSVELSDGRTRSVPLAWYPRLLHGTQAARQRSRLIGNGEGIHWPDLEEDISVEGLLAGRPSSESPASLRRWLSARPE
jgi:Protein of unknown function (DUF2442)